MDKFKRCQGRRFPFIPSSPCERRMNEQEEWGCLGMMLYCIKSYHGKEWYEIGITLVILKAIGYNKADTFTPIISAWVRLGPLIQSLQRAKESLTQICLFLLSSCKWAWWQCGSCHQYAHLFVWRMGFPTGLHLELTCI
jgi:hypothetical protein